MRAGCHAHVVKLVRSGDGGVDFLAVEDVLCTTQCDERYDGWLPFGALTIQKVEYLSRRLFSGRTGVEDISSLRMLWSRDLGCSSGVVVVALRENDDSKFLPLRIFKVKDLIFDRI